MGPETVAGRIASAAAGTLAVAILLAVAGCDNPSGGTPGTTPSAEVSRLHADSDKGQIGLTWSDPADSDFDHVQTSWEPEDGGSQPRTVAAGTESATATGPTNGTGYSFTVKTVDASGNTSETVSAQAAARDIPSLFVEMSVGLIGLEFGSSSSGYADGDGALHVVIGGDQSVTGTQPSTKLYENRLFE